MHIEFAVNHVTHTWIHSLGRENIATITVPFAEMHSLSKYYNSIVRPIIVILINEMATFNEFSNITRTFDMQSSAWLVIFSPIVQDILIDYCHVPPGNPFHLSFNTEMAVLCPREEVLNEWYSVDGQSTEISKLAKWRIDSAQDFQLLTNLSLFERRTDMRGTVLRAVTVKVRVALRYERK